MYYAENVLSETGLETLRMLMKNKTCLLAFDFDGTLAPIVSNPDSANMHREIYELLLKLAELRSVLVITGRSISDVSLRIPQNIKYVLGNHGLEGSSLVTEENLKFAKEKATEWTEILTKRLKEESYYVIENKTYSVSVHFRKTYCQSMARFRAHREACYLKPLPKILDGKSVINLIPEGLPDKYIALNALMQENNFDQAIFVGDDVTDNQVFRAKNPQIMGIKIGTNRDLVAPWFLKEQSNIFDLLEELLRM